MPPRQFDGQRVRDARRAARLTQGDLGEILGLSKTAVGDWENGKKSPNADRLPSIAKALGQRLDTLFPRLGDPDLSDLRCDAGYTQGDAAKALGIHRPPLSLAENGESRLSPSLVPRAAKLYEVSVEELEAAQDRSFGILTTSASAPQTPCTLGEKISFLLQSRQVTDEAIAAAINAKAHAEIIEPAAVEALRTEALPAQEVLEGLPMATVYEGLAEALGATPLFFQSGEEVERDFMERLRFLSLVRREGVNVAARGAEQGISSDMLATVAELLQREADKHDPGKQ
ncbi:helix-turn-helix transcriptional regulator [Streptomyces sp. NPDC020096]